MIEFNTLRALYDLHRGEIDDAVGRVLGRGWFVMGPELEAFEREFAAYHGGGHAVGVASGTDAIELALRAAGVGCGDEVITVAHTAVATVCAIERSGALPVLVDIDPRSFTIDPSAVTAAITPRTRAVVAVHLYGHPADLAGLRTIIDAHGLLLLEDCAQAHGARFHDRLVGTFGDLAAFSFYPTKNLGAFGDGGAVLTRDPALAERVRRGRNYGQVERYHHLERGVNSRLDELQAAILRARLAHLDGHNDKHRRLARLYAGQLPGDLLPHRWGGEGSLHHVYHLLVIRHPRRDELRRELGARGIGTSVHYPVPVHLQPAYSDLGYAPGSLPVTERAAREVLSLPLFIGLTDEQVGRVAEAVRAAGKEAA